MRFTTRTREAVRDALVETARADDAVAAAALVGSGATGREDEWSDIDLVLRVAADGDPADVAARWTDTLYAAHGAVHHLDVVADGVLYRVFLLAGSLQVDVSFWPYERFRETVPGFRLLFGETNPPAHLPPPDPERLIGLAWLHALHARSAIARGRPWQAVTMLDGVREQLVSLACLRNGLSPHQGRGVDGLPAAELGVLAGVRAAGTGTGELRTTHEAAVRAIHAEAARHDPALADRLAGAFEDLRSTR
ncbi:nucleotidyltransferase domain-containing protein [Promicromonospora sp. NPDC050249]|uniref:nucleotidyltransferase domain-containing protein n=1 Tax=Promicromonospora sp. NPDC050249 TaxID=3154743 RepID=UPI0034051191